jgi:hypothetical protein
MHIIQFANKLPLFIYLIVKLLSNQTTTRDITQSLETLAEANLRYWSDESQRYSELDFVEIKGVGPVVVPAHLRHRVGGKRQIEGEICGWLTSRRRDGFDSLAQMEMRVDDKRENGDFEYGQHYTRP